MGPRATLFFGPTVQRIEIPVAALLNPAQPQAEVYIFVNDRLADRMTIVDREWHRVRLGAPREVKDFWQIELRVTPTWVPRLTVADNADERELGLKVGEVVVN